MAIYTERVQAVLTKEQHELLRQLAQARKASVSVLVRQAVEQVYLHPAEAERRQAALRNFLSLNLPVADWEQMEEEIIRAHIE